MKRSKMAHFKLFSGMLPVIAVGSLGLMMISHNQPPKERVIEASKIILNNEAGSPSIILDASGSSPQITMIGKNGLSQIEILGGDLAKILIKDPSGSKEMIQIALTEESSPVISLNDAAGISRVQLQGGKLPAYFLKNEKSDIIGTILTLQDGGAALGLADKEGDVSAFLRGGYTPSISFFQKSAEPLVALGISRQVPHLLVASPSTKDNLVLHGGDPTSVLFVDEQGEIPVLLSKHGLFQGKKQQSQQSETKKDEKLFTWDELKNPLKDIQLPKR